MLANNFLHKILSISSSYYYSSAEQFVTFPDLVLFNIKGTTLNYKYTFYKLPIFFYLELGRLRPFTHLYVYLKISIFTITVCRTPDKKHHLFKTGFFSHLLCSMSACNVARCISTSSQVSHSRKLPTTYKFHNKVETHSDMGC